MNAGICSLSLRPQNDRKGVQRPHAQTTPLFGRALRGSAGLGEAVGEAASSREYSAHQQLTGARWEAAGYAIGAGQAGFDG
jgi:hypothetical protein